MYMLGGILEGYLTRNKWMCDIIRREDFTP